MSTMKTKATHEHDVKAAHASSSTWIDLTIERLDGTVEKERIAKEINKLAEFHDALMTLSDLVTDAALKASRQGAHKIVAYTPCHGGLIACAEDNGRGFNLIKLGRSAQG